LNVVWRLHAGEPLFRIGRAEAAGKLVLEAATAEEFESRLSALCGIRGSVNLPEGSGKKLIDLESYLKDASARNRQIARLRRSATCGPCSICARGDSTRGRTTGPLVG
jgi:hypothetical protein